MANEIHKGKLEKNLFYCAWSAGFIFYGLQIILRQLWEEILYIFGGIAYLLIMIGIWSLIGKRGILIISGVVIALYSASLLNLLTIQGELFATYAVITVGIIYLRFGFGETAETLVWGWAVLCLTNVLLLGFGWIADVFAILSKLIIFSGIVNREFSTLPKRLEALLASKKSYPIDADVSESMGRLILAAVNSKLTRAAEIKWIQRQIVEALVRNMDTYLFFIENLPPLDELRRLVWMNPSKVHILIFSSSVGEMRKEFTVLDPDLQAIGASLHELLRISASKKQKCNIIIDNISTMVQLFGGPQTYRLFLQKIGALRESRAFVYGLLHSDLHEASVTAMFQKLSDSSLAVE